MAYQIQVMSTDIRNSTEIALAYEGETSTYRSSIHFDICTEYIINSFPLNQCMIEQADTRLIRLGINGTVIILRAVSHHAALYWVEV
jgi:hypothetical protein